MGPVMRGRTEMKIDSCSVKHIHTYAFVGKQWGDPYPHYFDIADYNAYVHKQFSLQWKNEPYQVK